MPPEKCSDHSKGIFTCLRPSKRSSQRAHDTSKNGTKGGSFMPFPYYRDRTITASQAGVTRWHDAVSAKSTSILWGNHKKTCLNAGFPHPRTAGPGYNYFWQLKCGDDSA